VPLYPIAMSVMTFPLTVSCIVKSVPSIVTPSPFHNPS